MLGMCELVAVGILLLCNCLNLMNVFGFFDGHQVRPIASLTNFAELFGSPSYDDTPILDTKQNSNAMNDMGHANKMDLAYALSEDAYLEGDYVEQLSLASVAEERE
jgi:hypothetical protein